MIPPLLALASGVLLSAALPPTGLWPFALALTVLFVLVSHAERPGQAFGLGAYFALGFYAIYILWLPLSFAEPGMLGPFFWLLYPLLLLVLMAMWGIVTFLSSLIAGRGGAVLLVLPPLWVLMEWARTQGYFAFPWGTLGYVWLETPVAQVADTVGVTGLSFLTTVAAAGLAAPFAARGVRRFRGRTFPTARVVAPVLAVLALAGAWWWGDGRLAPDVGPLEATALLVQGNVDPYARALAAAAELEVHATITEIGVSGMAAPPDLVVWPEGAVSGAALDQPQGSEALARLQASAPESAFVVGGRGQQNGAHFNSVYAVAEGRVIGRYDKHVLVPFGERWPLLETAAPIYRGVFSALNLPMLVNTTAGPGPVPVTTPLGAVAVTVCYESVFPQVTAGMVAAGGRVMVNVTNDAWFARGNGARQHFDMGRMRAIETRRFLLRAGNDGITGLVDPYGRVLAELPRGIAGQLAVRFGLRDEVTPFARYGGWWPHALVGLTLAASLAALVRRRA